MYQVAIESRLLLFARYVTLLPGLRGRNEGNNKNSGGTGLHPDHSYVPSTFAIKKGKEDSGGFFFGLSIFLGGCLCLDVSIAVFDCLPSSYQENNNNNNQNFIWLPKGKSFPRLVSWLHHRDQVSISGPLKQLHLCLLQVLLQANAVLHSLVLCSTLCYGSLCGIPIHHLHSATN